MPKFFPVSRFLFTLFFQPGPSWGLLLSLCHSTAHFSAHYLCLIRSQPVILSQIRHCCTCVQALCRGQVLVPSIRSGPPRRLQAPAEVRPRPHCRPAPQLWRPGRRPRPAASWPGGPAEGGVGGSGGVAVGGWVVAVRVGRGGGVCGAAGGTGKGPGLRGEGGAAQHAGRPRCSCQPPPRTWLSRCTNTCALFTAAWTASALPLR